jgi:alkylation response protein AidB-like acyl-CoA dehydrogenase
MLLLARDEAMSGIDWVARAAALTPMIAAAADRIESERRIVPEIVSALHESGLLRMLLPVSRGGFSADLISFNQAVETVAAADASTAWCLSQQAATTQTANFLDPEIAREIFAAPESCLAWGPVSGAKAVIADGGYIVSGRWRFASGSEHCPWLGGHCAVIGKDGEPQLDNAGRPVMRSVLFRKEKAQIFDIWDVLGLRGTSSNAYEVKDLFVPHAYSTWRDSVPDRRGDEPLGNIPVLTLYGIGFAGVALGIARACLNAFMKLAETKKPVAVNGPPILLRDNAVVQSRVAEATGQLNGARAYLHEMLHLFWDAATAHHPVTLEQRAQLRIAIVGAIDQACRVADFSFRAAGSDAIFAGSAFERRFRDIHTLAAQGQAHLSNYEGAGQALFGTEPVQRL